MRPWSLERTDGKPSLTPKLFSIYSRPSEFRFRVRVRVRVCPVYLPSGPGLHFFPGLMICISVDYSLLNWCSTHDGCMKLSLSSTPENAKTNRAPPRRDMFVEVLQD
ncbi:hypothetical protein RvY_06874 [Ramazzottius varieornatus]|uniref:Uncharacterized protein n=1 Tax=Ramazzottius varieornatus TaxID=947166 RepID=A0A1D1V0G4_RAMVA|nr:hypothetical protein RvY_06874 [Ramazzottius varieornatus]